MMNVYQPITDMYIVFFIKYKIKSIACWFQCRIVYMYVYRLYQITLISSIANKQTSAKNVQAILAYMINHVQY